VNADVEHTGETRAPPPVLAPAAPTALSLAHRNTQQPYLVADPTPAGTLSRRMHPPASAMVRW
jgi:hypothetical protein